MFETGALATPSRGWLDGLLKSQTCFNSRLCLCVHPLLGSGVVFAVHLWSNHLLAH